MLKPILILTVPQIIQGRTTSRSRIHTHELGRNSLARGCLANGNRRFVRLQQLTVKSRGNRRYQIINMPGAALHDILRRNRSSLVIIRRRGAREVNVNQQMRGSAGKRVLKSHVSAACFRNRTRCLSRFHFGSVLGAAVGNKGLPGLFFLGACIIASSGLFRIRTIARTAAGFSAVNQLCYSVCRVLGKSFNHKLLTGL